MIVVCDTNVFVRETHLLRKKGGRELVRFLQATNGRLLVPDVLYREYVEQTLETAKEHWAKADKALSVLETLIAFRHDRVFPGEDVVKQLVIERLRTLESLTLRCPLNEELLVAAGRRSLENRRPTSKTDHGYKDCLIWESVLRLPAGSEVRVISHDLKAFFDGNELAKDLGVEVKALGIRVVGYQNIEDLLRELENDNSAKDLSAPEVLDLAEHEDETLDEAALPAAPLPEMAKLAPAQAEIDNAAAVQAVAHQLAQAQQGFDALDLKILAYIAYLDSPSKDELLSTLALDQIPAEIAGNVIDRLVITGFVRDTGNHYLVADRTMGEIIAPSVENEIIALLERA